MVYLEGDAPFKLGPRTAPPLVPMIPSPLPFLPPMSGYPPLLPAPLPAIPYGLGSPMSFGFSDPRPRALSTEVYPMGRMLPTMGPTMGPIRATSMPLAPRPEVPSRWTETFGVKDGRYRPTGLVNQHGVEVPHSKSSRLRRQVIYPNEHRGGTMREGGERTKSLWAKSGGFLQPASSRELVLQVPVNKH
jgi:hypothetical protein